MDLNRILINFAELELLISSVALVLLLAFKVRRSSFYVIVSLSLALSFVHQDFTESILVLSAMDSCSIAYTNIVFDCNVAGKHVWYLFFAITDFAFVIFCILFCNKYKLEQNQFGNYILMIFILLGFVQLLRWLDRLVFDLNLLGGFYSIAIPTLNTVMAVTLIVGVVITIYKKWRTME